MLSFQFDVWNNSDHFLYTKIGSPTVPNMLHGWVVRGGPGGELPNFSKTSSHIMLTLFLYAQNRIPKGISPNLRIFEGI